MLLNLGLFLRYRIMLTDLPFADHMVVSVVTMIFDQVGFFELLGCLDLLDCGFLLVQQSLLIDSDLCDFSIVIALEEPSSDMGRWSLCLRYFCELLLPIPPLQKAPPQQTSMEPTLKVDRSPGRVDRKITFIKHEVVKTSGPYSLLDLPFECSFEGPGLWIQLDGVPLVLLRVDEVLKLILE
jgi:hypothetical protein